MKIHNIFFTLTITGFLLSLSITSHAQKGFNKEIGIQSDNDLYASFYYDRYYTNGFFLHYKYLSKNTSTKKINEFEVGQKIFTPNFSFSDAPESIDRPYAGYSFLKYSTEYFSRKNYSLKFSFELGVLGPGAMAQEFQEYIHELSGFKSSDGWNQQIQKTMGVNMGFDFTKPFSKKTKKNIDFTSISTLKVGTIICEFTTNIYGRINLLKGNLNTYSNSTLFGSNLNPENTNQNKELFFYVKPQIGYAFYNATIQGSMFNDESPITYGIEAFIYEVEFGIKYAIKKFDFSYARITHSKKTIKIETELNTYGAIKIDYKFN